MSKQHCFGFFCFVSYYRTTYTYLQCEPNEDGALNVLGEITPDGNYVSITFSYVFRLQIY